MHKYRLNFLAIGLLVGALLVSGCKDDSPVAPDNGGTPTTNPVPDFTMTDVNATSSTFDQGVSPRDHLQKVSAWYFGHAT